MERELHGTAASYIAAVGQRYTAGRRALVEALAGALRPLTLPEILESTPGLAQSSAYRNLTVLEQAGVVHRVAAPGDFARYELAEELTGHHHHLICTSCGTVSDIDVPTHLERTLERALGSLADEGGFELAGHRLDVIGVCASCRRTRRRA